jgi:hypothetical protein
MTEVSFLRAVTRYRMMNHEYNEDIREDFGIADIHMIMETYQKILLKHLEKMPKNQIKKLFYQYACQLKDTRCWGCLIKRWNSFNLCKWNNQKSLTHDTKNDVHNVSTAVVV